MSKISDWVTRKIGLESGASMVRLSESVPLKRVLSFLMADAQFLTIRFALHFPALPKWTLEGVIDIVLNFIRLRREEGLLNMTAILIGPLMRFSRVR